MGPQLKVSSERQEKWGINLAIPGFVVYITAPFSNQLKSDCPLNQLKGMTNALLMLW